MSYRLQEQSEASRAPDGQGYSLTVDRALRGLQSFRQTRPELGIAELSRELPLSKAAVHRIVRSLSRHGFLEQNPATRKYCIGAEAFRIGSLYDYGSRLRQLALPVLRELVRQSGHTSYLSVRQDDHMLIVGALEGTGPITYRVPTGAQLVLNATATGKAALSALSPREVERLIDRIGLVRRTAETVTERGRFLEEIERARGQGFATNWGENNVGVASVAAPIRDAGESLLAVVSIGFAIGQVAFEQLDALGAVVADAARAIAAAAGAQGAVRKKRGSRLSPDTP